MDARRGALSCPVVDKFRAILNAPRSALPKRTKCQKCGPFNLQSRHRIETIHGLYFLAARREGENGMSGVK